MINLHENNVAGPGFELAIPDSDMLPTALPGPAFIGRVVHAISILYYQKNQNFY